MARTTRLAIAMTAAAALAGALAPGPAEARAPRRTASLYKRLGGVKAIRALVDDFVANVAADARINRYFAEVDIPNLKTRLVEQISEAAGGPWKYTGGSMKAVHEGLGITNAEFDALVEDLVKALDKHKVPKKEKDELLALLGPMRADIVERP